MRVFLLKERCSLEIAHPIVRNSCIVAAEWWALNSRVIMVRAPRILYGWSGGSRPMGS